MMIGKTYEYNGRMLTVAELSKMSGKSEQCIRWRLKQGYSTKDAMEIPLGRTKRRSKSDAPCGFTSMFDCLECKYERCISESYRAIPGETTTIVRWEDYDEIRH